ncbi:hypothetical protein [Methanogenium cariaci]|uniref:hypothetical protein n=1 Tax=Methanogenium cariaci TaxID=2197 RepID=UPI000785085D|nr:hypothetical protein [Methanogenium cariaci]
MDTDLDSTFEGIYSCTMQENPRQFITEVITDLFFENQTKQEIFYDVQGGLYPGKFPNEEIDQIIKTVFESNTSEQTDFHLTDVGNSERFIKEHGNNLLFCSGIKLKVRGLCGPGKYGKR